MLDRVWGGHRHLSVSVPGSLEALVEQLLAGVTELETTQAQRDRVIATAFPLCVKPWLMAVIVGASTATGVDGFRLIHDRRRRGRRPLA